MSRDDLHFRLRIPDALKARVQYAATANGRSMTAEIIAALEKAYPAPLLTMDEIFERSEDLMTRIQATKNPLKRMHLARELRELNDEIARATAALDDEPIT